jgi:diguanylate cyclase (GGDEF)-like protein
VLRHSSSKSESGGRVICLAVALLYAFPLRAADPERWSAVADTSFRPIVEQDGRPLPFVDSVAEDGQGFIWAGTEDGLVRWDGYHLRRYRRDGKKPGAIPDSFVVTLHKDARGRLWIGTETEGLTRYEPECDCFSVYSEAAGQPPVSTVSSIEDDGVGGLWLATNRGLDHLDGDSNRIASVPIPAGDLALPAPELKRLLRDRHGRLWVGTDIGLVRLDFRTGAFTPIAATAVEGFKNNVRSLFEDAEGRIWVGTIRNGAYILDPNTGQLNAVRETTGDSTLASQRVMSIIESGAGEIWLGTGNSGIVAVNTANGSTRRMRHDQALRSTLPDDEVTSLVRDRSGVLWAGTGRGLTRCDDVSGSVQTLFAESTRKRGLSGTDVYTMIVRPDGRIWAGLRQGGIDVVDPLAGTIQNLPADPRNTRLALPVNNINVLAPTDSGRVQIGTDSGLYILDPARKWVLHPQLPGQKPNASVLDLVDAFGRRWIGTDGDGVWALPLSEKSAPAGKHFTWDQLTDARVQVMKPGAGREMWIGTANGLNRIDIDSGSVERFLPDRNDPRSLSARFVATLLVDRTGRLWVGTDGGGIDVLMRRTDGHAGFERIGTEQGLPSSNIDCILADGSGRIWASSDDGLASIDPVSFAVHAFQWPDGVEIADYTGNSCTATPQGELLFGGQGGVTILRPDRLAKSSYRPPTVVTGIWVGGVPATLASSSAPLHPASAIVVPSVASLGVEFAALDFSAPQSNRYEYWLQGFDHNWNVTDASRRVASYTNLPPGSYTLHMRGSNRDGLWSARERTVPVQVLPAWYQTWWCKALVLALIGGLIACITELRTRMLRNRQQELARQVEDRTAELVESKRQLEEIAYIDPLTALANRRRFTAELRLLLLTTLQRDSGFGLLLIDLDRFKGINDSLGHDAGDALLVETAARLKSAVREGDLVARLGGDEFAILLVGGSDRLRVEQICTRIVELFGPPVAFKGATMRTTPSIGAALYPQDARTEEALLKAADVALYAAKHGGSNTWRFALAAAAG